MGNIFPKRLMKIITFYLPQFHTFPENDNGGERALQNG